MDQSLNTTHIANNLSQYEHARSSFFVFQVAPDQLTNLVHPDFVGTKTPVLSGAELRFAHLSSVVKTVGERQLIVVW